MTKKPIMILAAALMIVACAGHSFASRPFIKDGWFYVNGEKFFVKR